MPHPRPAAKGPSEYIPSSTYPDPFVNMVPGYVPMHRRGCFSPCIHPPEPEPEPLPGQPCPPKVYREQPEVEVVQGDHIRVEKTGDDLLVTFRVSSIQYPVILERDSEDILFGDGTPESPLGIYDFAGATATDKGTAGVVPAPEAGEHELFLRGDGTWAAPSLGDLPEFTGATSTAPGEKGLVPAPSKGDRNLFLRGDGTWAKAGVDIAQGDHIKVTRDDSGSVTKYTIAATQFPTKVSQASSHVLTGDGTTSSPLDLHVFTGATRQANGKSGIVPAPSKTDVGLFLSADGTWAKAGVDIVEGSHIRVTRNDSGAVTQYTIEATRFPVEIDRNSADALTGDGSPEHPLTVHAFVGATQQANGKMGAVPSPASADKDKFLRGDGTWAVAGDQVSECTAQEMDDWIDEVENG